MHKMLLDENFTLHEINRDSSLYENGWMGYLSNPLPKHTFRAAVDGSGLFQIMNGIIVNKLKLGEFIFVSNIGNRNVF